MTALYTFSFIVSWMPLLSQTLSQSHLKADLTLALHELTSLLMTTGWESMLCRYMNLSITLTVCSLTVMAGTTNIFYGAGWCRMPVYLVLIESPKLSQMLENQSMLSCITVLVAALRAHMWTDRWLSSKYWIKRLRRTLASIFPVMTSSRIPWWLLHNCLFPFL